MRSSNRQTTFSIQSGNLRNFGWLRPKVCGTLLQVAPEGELWSSVTVQPMFSWNRPNCADVEVRPTAIHLKHGQSRLSEQYYSSRDNGTGMELEISQCWGSILTLRKLQHRIKKNMSQGNSIFQETETAFDLASPIMNNT